MFLVFSSTLPKKREVHAHINHKHYNYEDVLAVVLSIQGDHFELSQKLLMITFKEKRICQAAILHIVDVFSPFDNNTPTSSNAS